MKFGRNIFFITGLYSSPGTLTGPTRDIPENFYRELVINFRLLVVNIFGTFHVTRKAYLAYAYRVIRVRGQASLDPKNFGPRRNFSIFIWLVLWSGKFILALSIFGRFSICIKGFM